MKSLNVSCLVALVVFSNIASADTRDTPSPPSLALSECAGILLPQLSPEQVALFGKVAIVDTNMMMAGTSFFANEDNTLFVIPITVLEELERNKVKPGLPGAEARKAVLNLAQLTEGHPTNGIYKLRSGSGIFLDLADHLAALKSKISGLKNSLSARQNHPQSHNNRRHGSLHSQRGAQNGKLDSAEASYLKALDDMMKVLTGELADHKIIGAIVDFKLIFPGVNVEFYSKDGSAGLIAKSMGINTNNLKSRAAQDAYVDGLYTGHSRMVISAGDYDRLNQLDRHSAKEILKMDKTHRWHRPFFPNEYVVFLRPNQVEFENEDLPLEQLIGCYDQKTDSFNFLTPVDLLPEPRPINLGLRMADHALHNPELNAVAITGVAGSGKTFAALSAGMSQVRTNNYPRRFGEIVITKAPVPVGGKEMDIGFLPGTEEQKLEPHLMGFQDNYVAIMDILDRAGREQKQSSEAPATQASESPVVAEQVVEGTLNPNLEKQLWLADQSQRNRRGEKPRLSRSEKAADKKARREQLASNKPPTNNYRRNVLHVMAKAGKRAPYKAVSIFDQPDIKIQDMARVRGRSIGNTWLIVDEAQNLSAGVVETLVTRPRDNSMVVLLGDTDQIDTGFNRLDNGLSVLINGVGGDYNSKQIPVGSERIVVLRLERSERSDFARYMVDLFRRIKHQ